MMILLKVKSDHASKRASIFRSLDRPGPVPAVVKISGLKSGRI